MGKAQLDMFAADEAELFDAVPVVAVPDAERVRGRLKAMLDEARAAEGQLPAMRQRYIAKVVPQMSRALPEAERTALLEQFSAALSSAFSSSA